MTTATTLSPTKLVDALQARHARRLESERKTFRQDHPRASSIGECAREIYHQIVDWAMKPPPSIALAARFGRGNDVEKIVTRQLIEEGWDIVEQQLPFEIKEKHPRQNSKDDDLIICTGHADLRIAWNGTKPVGEIKSLNPNVWARIDSIDDFVRMGGFWTRYTNQLPLYCYAHDEPLGLFILDDCLGHRKYLPMILEEHLDECEAALQKCRAAKLGTIAGEPPDFCTDPTACMNCWCREVGVCMPPLDFSGDGVHVLDDAELAADLLRLDELAEDAKERAAIDKRVKTAMKARGAGQYVAGEYLITVKARPRKAYDIPADVKAKYAREDETVYTTWARMDAITEAETDA